MIQEVTKAIAQLIETGTPQLGAWVEPTGLQADAGDPEPGKLALCLHAIEELTDLHNLPPAPDDHAAVTRPQSLRLSYVMAYYGKPPRNHHLDEQDRIDLVRAVLHQTPVIGPDQLGEGVAATVERLTLVVESPSIEARSQIWAAFGRPMRLALYCAAVVVPAQQDRSGDVGTGGADLLQRPR